MVRVEINRFEYMRKEAVDIDFENMAIHVKKVSFNIYRDKGMWLFSPSSGAARRRALTDGASKTIEKAYVQWTLEQTILGG